ncbi:MAG: hypothetical protein R2789_11860 [Microthrixaceae bacterium]
MDGIGSDIADPEVVESAYSDAAGSVADPVRCGRRVQQDLPWVTQPLLLMNSPQDHVVPPTDSDLLAESVSGPVERVSSSAATTATQDYDK